MGSALEFKEGTAFCEEHEDEEKLREEHDDYRDLHDVSMNTHLDHGTKGFINFDWASILGTVHI